MDRKSVENEHKRLESLLDKAEVPQIQRDALAGVVDNLSWMRVKLDETREIMGKAQVVCKYNNGGGQSGMRENPIFKGYLNLWRGYMVGIEKFSAYLPKDLKDEVMDENNVLDKVLKARRA